MSYAVVTAVIFAFVAIMHGWRIYKQWEVQIGPHFVSMTVLSRHGRISDV